jgi:DNA helicase-2/ATP-dependent DNA helicase PcrA
MTAEEFIALVGAALGPTRAPNKNQAECLKAGTSKPLLIVAGPGTGKTTALVLRALRHVIVDQMAPEHIMITTFTRKAAKEVRTRLIEWGEKIISHILEKQSSRLAPTFLDFIRSVDINRFITGTLDSLCEQILADDRNPNERPATVIEQFAANQILARQGGVYGEVQAVGDELKSYLAQFAFDGDPPETIGDITRILRTLIDRFVQDEVDVAAYSKSRGHKEAKAAVVRIYDRYRSALAADNQMDFALLEERFLARIRRSNQPLPTPLQELKALLVDEYQDTNPIQERIYFELAKRTSASLTAVGDDDQSLYRFRGATIELFRDFARRAQSEYGLPTPKLEYLIENYRSTPDIVSFFNSFIKNDPDFAGARISPPKPDIKEKLAKNNVPVLGMFRETPEELAEDLAKFLNQVFRTGGRPADDRLNEVIRCAPSSGDVGDAVVLGSTVNEFKRPFMGQPAKPRLPSLLRNELAQFGIGCFNPRGRALRDVPQVRLLLGLVLESIDPSSAENPAGRLAPDMAITLIAKNAFGSWRTAASQFLANKPKAVNGKTISGVLTTWRDLTVRGTSNGSEWPILDLFYSFIPWIIEFQNDPECQVYLEAISRCAAQAATFSAYRALLLRDNPHRQRSIEGVLRDVLAPIADDLVDVDEEIMPSVPRTVLNLMTIHQAKGLEFPLVIVDVSSDFTMNHPKNRFKRFPDDPSPVTVMEDELASCTPIGPLRAARTAIQRSFEDLIRQSYVAYSRPQNVLLLVGCVKTLSYKTSIKVVANCWRANSTWAWRRDPLIKRSPPPMADNIPLRLL